MTGTDEAVETAKEAMKEQRPLNATQGRNLLRIVKNDFERLKAELDLFEREEAQRREKEIRDQFKISIENKKVLEDDIRDLQSEYRAKADALHARARAMGLTVTQGMPYPAGTISFNEQRVFEEINTMKRQLHAEICIARNIAEAKFYEAERLVLLATVTGDAEKILGGIPTAEQLMAVAYEQRAQQRQELTGGSK